DGRELARVRRLPRRRALDRILVRSPAVAPQHRRAHRARRAVVVGSARLRRGAARRLTHVAGKLRIHIRHWPKRKTNVQKSAIVFVLGMLAGAALLGAALAQTTSAQFRAVNHIGIVVADYQESLDFYTNVLGAKVAY